MRINAANLILVVLVTLASASLVCWSVGDPYNARRSLNAGEFQRVVGGLGLGPATNWARCAHSFDPRVCGDCEYDQGPLVGRTCFCPWASESIFNVSRGLRVDSLYLTTEDHGTAR